VPGAPARASFCAALKLSRSGYYAHRHKPRGARRRQDAQLREVVTECFRASRHTYGTPRLRAELREMGHRLGRRRIARLMREQGLRPKQKRRFIPKTTDSRHGRPVAPNLLLDRPAPDAPGQVWLTDITYIPTREGWLYLAAEMDLFSRRIVGWDAREHMERGLVISALENAVAASGGSLRGLIHHSDQGSQYASHDFTAKLTCLGIEASMSRRGNCYDNAAMESFWATLKAECFDREIPATRRQARSMIFDYIETFYNPRRRHCSLGYLSPDQFEHQTQRVSG
jgi:transposase InsO family protein